MSFKSFLFGLSFIAFTTLFTPFIWMEIGPNGITYYGSTVPDVYIYGGLITGKDYSFWGIEFAQKFQLFWILTYIILTTVAAFTENRSARAGILLFTMIILGLFPFWLDAYISGVFNNSDGAASDMIIHHLHGMTIYWILFSIHLILVLAAIISALRTKRKPKNDLLDLEENVL